MAKRRSRRLRKKLYVGEFKELGFAVDIGFHQPMDAPADEDFVTTFLLDLVMPQGLAFAGWADGGFVVRRGRGSVTEAEREIVIDWLRKRPEVARIEATALDDVWYGFGPGRTT